MCTIAMAESFSLFAPAAEHDLSGSAVSSRKNTADDLEDSWWAEEEKADMSFAMSACSTEVSSQDGMGSRQSLSSDDSEEEHDAVWEREVQIVQLSEQHEEEQRSRFVKLSEQLEEGPQQEQHQDAVLTRRGRTSGARRMGRVDILGDICGTEDIVDILGEVKAQLYLKGLVCEKEEGEEAKVEEKEEQKEEVEEEEEVLEQEEEADSEEEEDSDDWENEMWEADSWTRQETDSILHSPTMDMAPTRSCMKKAGNVPAEETTWDLVANQFQIFFCLSETRTTRRVRFAVPNNF